jgi:hypothetical protein
MLNTAISPPLLPVSGSVNTIVCPPYNYFLFQFEYICHTHRWNIFRDRRKDPASCLCSLGEGNIYLVRYHLTSPGKKMFACTGLKRPAKAGYLVWKIVRKPIDQLVDNLLTVLLVIVITWPFTILWYSLHSFADCLSFCKQLL